MTTTTTHATFCDGKDYGGSCISDDTTILGAYADAQDQPSSVTVAATYEPTAEERALLVDLTITNGSAIHLSAVDARHLARVLLGLADGLDTH